MGVYKFEVQRAKRCRDGVPGTCPSGHDTQTETERILGEEKAKRGRRGFPGRRKGVCTQPGVEKGLGHLRDGGKNEVPGTLWVETRDGMGEAGRRRGLQARQSLPPHRAADDLRGVVDVGAL